MNWFENKDKLINVLKLKAPVIGVDAENIVFGGQVQIPPCVNIHLTSSPAEQSILSSGHRVAGKMDISAVVTVPGSMNDSDTQDEAMKIAIEIMKVKPAGFYFEGISPLYIADLKGNISDTCAMVVEMYVLYSV